MKEDNYVDSIYIVIIVVDYGCFFEGNNGVKKLGFMDVVFEVVSIIRYYVLVYVRQGNMFLVLEYYVQVVVIVGGGVVVWSGYGNSDQ